MAVFTSKFGIGDKALFQPRADKIQWDAQEQQNTSTDPYSAIECEIIGVTFRDGIVLYAIKVVSVEGADRLYSAMDGIHSIHILPIES